MARVKYRPSREDMRPDYARRAHWGGRHDAYDESKSKLALTRIRLDSGGYDRGGRYYGRGPALFNVQDDDGLIDFDLRAADRTAAKREVQRMYPRARFHR